MTTATTSLTDFLLARIAEDEARATLATRGITMGRWIVDPGEASDEDVHIARWDPARVLAECEAKRKLVELFMEPQGLTETSAVRVFQIVRIEVFTLMALPYADHPDCREEWRP